MSGAQQMLAQAMEAEVALFVENHADKGAEPTMNSFRDNRLRDHAIPMSTAWLLNHIAEFKGKQEAVAIRQPPMLFRRLAAEAAAAAPQARVEQVPHRSRESSARPH